jgi:hypothetical protein
MKMPKRQREQIAAEEAAKSAAFEAGADYHRTNPKLILAEVHRYANRAYDQRRHEVEGFVDGFSNARRIRDDYLRECSEER